MRRLHLILLSRELTREGLNIMTESKPVKRSYKAGGQGGRTVIDFPGDLQGKRYDRSVWKDGKTIVYREVDE